MLVTDDSGITSPADLKGKQIGIPGLFGASYTGVIALLAANDLTEQDVQLQSIGFNAPQVICVGGVQAAVVYVNNEPLQIQDRIDKNDCGSVTGITVFPVSDAADMVSNGIVTNEETIASDPDAGHRLRRGVRSWAARHDQQSGGSLSAEREVRRWAAAAR